MIRKIMIFVQKEFSLQNFDFCKKIRRKKNREKIRFFLCQPNKKSAKIFFTKNYFVINAH